MISSRINHRRKRFNTCTPSHWITQALAAQKVNDTFNKTFRIIKDNKIQAEIQFGMGDELIIIAKTDEDRKKVQELIFNGGDYVAKVFNK